MRTKKSTNDYVANNFKAFQPIYNSINDSIHLYVDSMLSSYKKEYFSEWRTDSLLCINSENNLLVTTINQSSGIDTGTYSDQVQKLLGKKINGRWYFFKGGGSLSVPRDMYGKSADNPLSFYELSQIARKEFLEGALVKQPDGSYKVNDNWINNHFYYTGWCGDCTTNEQYDSVHWNAITQKWNYKIDTNEYKTKRKHLNNL